VCVCVCARARALWIANVLWLAVCLEGGNDTSICTDSPSCPCIRPVKLRTGGKSNAAATIRSEFPAPEQVHIAICFLGTVPTFKWPQSFRYLSVGTVKTPSVFSSNWNKEAFPTRILCLSNHSQLPQDLGKCAHARIGSGGGHFEHLLWIVTWWTVRTKRLLNWECVL
jgi:hypothetical protein